MSGREKFDSIFQSLTFGTKATKKYKSSADDEKLPLRLLPKDDPIARKRRKLDASKENVEEEGIRLFSESTAPISLSNKTKEIKKPEITADDKITKIRQLNQIFTWGSNIADPFINFKDLNLSKQLLKNIEDAGFSEPTPIQMQAVPILLNKRNLLANAPTGSGKTLAFILPILKLLLDSLKRGKQKSVYAVVLSPTNVLAQQIYVQFLKFAQDLPIQIGLLEPGTPIENAHILVTTPNKFIYSLKSETLNEGDLLDLRWLVLDEADRLFETTEGDRNFRLQFEEVHKACTGSHTKLAFFSATFSFELERFCKDKLDNTAMLCIGARNTANSAVKQELIYTGDENGKMFALEQIFNSGFEPPALIFLQSKERAGMLFVELQSRCPKISIRLISSELTNDAREKILDKFKSGEVWVLISTEMLGRGLDIPNVNLIVNFDLPTSIISYIHRIGRTGRAGRQGKSVTFYSHNDMDFVQPIATVIHQSGFPVPEYTLKLKKLNKAQKKWLLRHAPHRKNVGSIGRWNRVKKSAMKDRIIKRDPALLRKKKKKPKKKVVDENAPETKETSNLVPKKKIVDKKSVDSTEKSKNSTTKLETSTGKSKSSAKTSKNSAGKSKDSNLKEAVEKLASTVKLKKKPLKTVVKAKK